MEAIPKNSKYKVTICAVIFGADETLLNVDLGKGYEFRKMSLIPSKDQLELIFEVDAMGLRRDYERALIDNDLNLICAFKTYEINLSSIEAGEYYQKTCDDALNYLDNRIRAIRLYYEGPIRFKKLSIKMESETFYMCKTRSGISYNSIIPIGEAMGTKEISKFHCNDGEIRGLNNIISLIKFPLSDELLNHCHRYYDLSYHQDNFISITLLTTCLEILFLDGGQGKKEKLAKRCSVFLYDNKEERLSCYDKLTKLYKKRSDFVHDGDSDSIIDEDILFLRDCVRKSLIKYMNNGLKKKEVVNKLKTTITSLDYWSGTNGLKL